MLKPNIHRLPILFHKIPIPILGRKIINVDHHPVYHYLSLINPLKIKT